MAMTGIKSAARKTMGKPGKAPKKVTGLGVKKGKAVAGKAVAGASTKNADAAKAKKAKRNKLKRNVKRVAGVLATGGIAGALLTKGKGALKRAAARKTKKAAKATADAKNATGRKKARLTRKAARKTRKAKRIRGKI